MWQASNRISTSSSPSRRLRCKRPNRAFSGSPGSLPFSVADSKRRRAFALGRRRGSSPCGLEETSSPGVLRSSTAWPHPGDGRVAITQATANDRFAPEAADRSASKKHKCWKGWRHDSERHTVGGARHEIVGFETINWL